MRNFLLSLVILSITSITTYAYTISGSKWADTNISFSYVPDGTPWEGGLSTLFASLDAVAATPVWQREFTLALQTWANVSTLNFYQVSDDGSPSHTLGLAQGDPRFGDIRLGVAPLGSSVLGSTWYPNGIALGGNITLNSNGTFAIGSFPDLFMVLRHEVGHALGLRHSSVDGSVMRTAWVDSLHDDDIAGIQFLYGIPIPEPPTLALLLFGFVCLRGKRL